MLYYFSNHKKCYFLGNFQVIWTIYLKEGNFHFHFLWIMKWKISKNLELLKGIDSLKVLMKDNGQVIFILESVRNVTAQFWKLVGISKAKSSTFLSLKFFLNFVYLRFLHFAKVLWQKYYIEDGNTDMMSKLILNEESSTILVVSLVILGYTASCWRKSL